MPTLDSPERHILALATFGYKSMIDDVHSTQLPNGITVLSEHMPGLRSVTAGIWVRRGSRHESAELNGICHFIEHSVFKGTGRRSARDIAVESDRLGGQLDAYTTHEMTGFALKVADSGLPQAFDLIADIVSQPRFDQKDLEREQKVVLEEMKMVEDTPDELLGELFNAAYFPDQPLGRPIEGTEATVSSFDHASTSTFHAREFSPRNLVVAAAGNVEHARLVEMVERGFADMTGTENGSQASQSEINSSPSPAAPILIEHKEGTRTSSLDHRGALAHSPERKPLCSKPPCVSNRRRHFEPVMAEDSRGTRPCLFGRCRR